MTIELENNYFIDVDLYNYTLYKITSGFSRNNPNKMYTKKNILGYYHDIEGAVKKYIEANQIDAMSEKKMTLQEYVDTVKASNTAAVHTLTVDVIGSISTYVRKMQLQERVRQAISGNMPASSFEEIDCDCTENSNEEEALA